MCERARRGVRGEMWRSEDEEQADGWWTRYGSGTEQCWTKNPRRGYRSWTDSLKVGERFYTKEAKAAEVETSTETAVARRGTEKASATVATMATRKQVQGALQRKETVRTGTTEEGASRGAMPSSFAKSNRTNEQTKVKTRAPARTAQSSSTQQRTARFPRRREREMKSELFEAEKSLLVDKELEQLTCECDVAEETMSATVKLARSTSLTSAYRRRNASR